MADIEKLIEELRNMRTLDGLFAGVTEIHPTAGKAADTIAAQSARIEELEKQLQWNDAVVNGAVEYLESTKEDMSRDNSAAFHYSEEIENAASTLSENYKALKGGSDNG